jgi:hypothetical protein
MASIAVAATSAATTFVLDLNVVPFFIAAPATSANLHNVDPIGGDSSTFSAY